MRARTRALFAVLATTTACLVLTGPARGEWPLDFASSARIHTDGPGTASIRAETSFMHFLTPEIERAGETYLELHGTATPTAAARRVDVAASGPAGATFGSVTLSPDRWSAVSWTLHPGSRHERARALGADLAFELAAGSGLTLGGVEFADVTGRRVGWQDVPARGGTARSVHAVLEAAAPDVRRVSLWLRGSGTVRIGRARFHAIVLAPDPLLTGCGLRKPFALPLGSLSTRIGRHRSTGGVRKVAWIARDRLLVTFGPERGWQGVSVGIRSPRLMTADADLTATVSLELLRVEGVERFGFEQYADSEQRRIGWRELVAPVTGEQFVQPLQGSADRLGLWIVRGDRPSARLELRLRFGWRLLLRGVALGDRDTRCTLRGLPGGGALTMSHGRLGFRVESTRLAAAGFSRGEAAVAGAVLSVLAAAGAVLVGRGRLRLRAGRNTRD